MNCKEAQEDITASLAGALAISSEAASHQTICPACQAFGQEQQRLFSSLDAGLRAIANSCVPASLLPVVRARVEGQSARLHSWLPSWNGIGVATAAVLIGAIVLISRHPDDRQALPQPVAQMSHRPRTLSSATKTGADIGPKARRQLTPPRVAAKSVARVPEPALEVIVLPEERVAFEKFIRRLPQEEQVAVALTHPAPPGPDPPVEIALLDLGTLEVKPLESEARE